MAVNESAENYLEQKAPRSPLRGYRGGAELQEAQRQRGHEEPAGKGAYHRGQVRIYHADVFRQGDSGDDLRTPSVALGLADAVGRAGGDGGGGRLQD